MGLLAQGIEACGISTVCLALVRELAPTAPDRNRRQRGQGHHHYPVDIGRVAQAIVGDRDSGDKRWNAEGEIDDDEDRSEQPSTLVQRS